MAVTMPITVVAAGLAPQIMDDNVGGQRHVRPRILNLFEAARQEGRPLYVSAPMVRYSKLPFRLLVRDYEADVTYTPMMLAHEFIRAPVARDSDFTTCSWERQDNPASDQTPRSRLLIAQFASSEPEEFARAADMIGPWVDGVDLNCGCPQSWALKEGIGCSLMENPALVAEMVRAAKSRLRSDQSVSVKIRIHKDLARTVRWIEIVEQAGGVDYITVHARTRTQRSSTPPDHIAIRELKSHMEHIPFVANGDAYTLSSVRAIADQARADGVMAARGILENPAMFAGHNHPPAECVLKFLGYAVRCPIPFPLVLHHISEMTGKLGSEAKTERKRLMGCRDLIDLIDYVQARFSVA